MSQLYELWTTKSLEFITATATLGGISLIGLVGNGLIVAIILLLRMRGSKSAVQLFLLHLAISDLLVCILCIPLTVYSNFSYPQTNGSKENILCKITRFTQFLAPTISISLLATISIDRFYSIARPMLSRAPRPRLLSPEWMITMAWTYSVIIFTPTFYFSSLQPITTSTNNTVYYCTPIPNHSTAGFAFLIIVFLGAFMLPLGTMTVLYFRILRLVWNRPRKLSVSANGSTSSGKVLERSRKRVLFMLLIVLLVFITCWTPFVIYSGFVERRVKIFPNPMDNVRIILYGLGLSNSICNPFIYFFFTRGFSIESIKTLCIDPTATKRRNVLLSPRALEMEIRRNEVIRVITHNSNKTTSVGSFTHSPQLGNNSPDFTSQGRNAAIVQWPDYSNQDVTKTSLNCEDTPVSQRKMGLSREPLASVFARHCSQDREPKPRQRPQSIKWSNDENGVWTLCEDNVRSDSEESSDRYKNDGVPDHGTEINEDSSLLHHDEVFEEINQPGQAAQHDVTNKSASPKKFRRKLQVFLITDEVPETNV